MLLCIVFFFFKQKTAYEMRISDWSSDVCSSDLSVLTRSRIISANCCGKNQNQTGNASASRTCNIDCCREAVATKQASKHNQLHHLRALNIRRDCPSSQVVSNRSPSAQLRSEEHTSELQSLMRISYAVFCLNKKTTTIKANHITNNTNRTN